MGGVSQGGHPGGRVLEWGGPWEWPNTDVLSCFRIFPVVCGGERLFVLEIEGVSCGAAREAEHCIEKAQR